MALAAPRPCTYPGCAVLVRDGSGRCPKHPAAVIRARNRVRPPEQKRLYGWAWQKAARAFLADNPMCVCDECRGMKRVATVVDHKIPHRGDLDLFWDPANWQPMAKACHDRKTAREDGGFGNPRGAQ